MGSAAREILVLQHAACESLGTIEDALNQAGLRFRYIRGDLGEPIPRAIDDASALIVMGGPMGVYEQRRFPFLADELRLIESALKASRPTLGVCLGSQLLAAALGAEVRKGSRKEIGWHRVYLEPAAKTDRMFEGAPMEFDAFHWHGDIFDLPKNAMSLAYSKLTSCQAFQCGSAHAILFHMEVTKASAAGMAETFAEELAEEGISPKRLLGETEQQLAQLQSVGAPAFARWVTALSDHEY